MPFKHKLIQSLYEIVIYVFPFFLLFFVLVGFEMWKLENTKEEMSKRLESSNEMIEAARMELSALQKGLLTTTENFSLMDIGQDAPAVLPDLSEKNIKNYTLVELGVNVLKRVSDLKGDPVDYRLEEYMITEPTGRYYAVVITYSELGFAIVQREHLLSLGFGNVKILETDQHYALSIDDAASKTNPRLFKALKTWYDIFDGNADGYIKKF